MRAVHVRCTVYRSVIQLIYIYDMQGAEIIGMSWPALRSEIERKQGVQAAQAAAPHENILYRGPLQALLVGAEPAEVAGAPEAAQTETVPTEAAQATGVPAAVYTIVSYYNIDAACSAV